MALDLGKTALQLAEMALGIKARQSDRMDRLRKAVDTLLSFRVGEYETKRLYSESTIAWNVPAIHDEPGRRYPPPPLPENFCVAAVDGSHIDIDRHVPAKCFLINIGVSVIAYGCNPYARLYSEPRLYAAEDELVIRDELTVSREQAIEGAVLGAKRTVEEIIALAGVIKDLPENTPTLALMDGSLIMLGLLGYGNRGFVLRELIDEGFVKALETIRQMAESRPLAVASYISLPRSNEVINGTRLQLCPYEVASCDRYCGNLKTGQRPCDVGAYGLTDRDVFSEILGPGERSTVFTSSSPLVEKHYRGHEVQFFYVRVGEEIGRIEVPSWVAEDETLLGLVHSLVVDQCRRGPGYPTVLMEAHEQAVITGANRGDFARLLENALYDQRMPVYSSEKSRSKRIRWL